MTALYSLRTTPTPNEFTIIKLDDDLNVESLYAMNAKTCTCPAGTKPTCRHRKMLPLFLAKGHVNDGWFLDWDTRLWRMPISTDAYALDPRPELLADETILDNAPEQLIETIAKGLETEGSKLVAQPAIHEGDVPEQSTLAATIEGGLQTPLANPSTSASGRGQPSPELKRRRIF